MKAAVVLGIVEVVVDVVVEVLQVTGHPGPTTSALLHRIRWTARREARPVPVYATCLLISLAAGWLVPSPFRLKSRIESRPE
jgi:hypothetical protein